MRGRVVVTALAALLSCAPADLPPAADLSGLEAAVADAYRTRHDHLTALLRRAGAGDREIAVAWAELGAWHQAQLQFEAALDCYRSAVELDRGDPEWRALQASAELGAGRPERAYETLASAVADLPDSTPLTLELATAALRTGRLEEARERFADALEKDRRSVRARLGLGQTALAQGRFADAVSELRAASTLAPGVREIEQALGTAYRGTGDAERAAGHLRRAAGARPLDADPTWRERIDSASSGAQGHAARGRRARDTGRLPRAIVHFRRALEAAPDVAVHHQRLGATLLLAGEAAEARAVLAAAVARFPAHPGLLLELAKADAELGEPERALRALLELRAEDPTDLEVIRALEVVYARLGRFREADTACRAIRDERPDQPAVLVRCARWATLVGDFAAATEALEEALVLAPGHAEAELLLARMLAAAPVATLRDANRAAVLAQRGVARSRTPHALETLAMAHAEAGRFAAAIDAQAEAQRAQVARGDPTPWIAVRLDLYERGKPCREPLLSSELGSPAPPIAP